MAHKARRWVTILSCTAILTTSSRAVGIELEATPALGVAVALVSPRGKSPGVRATDLADAVKSALGARNRLRVEPAEHWGIEPEAIAECPQDTRFLCWVRSSSARGPGPSFLLVVSAFLVSETELRLTTYWIDLERARRSIEGGGEAADLDRGIFERTIAPEPARIAPGISALASYFTAWEQQISPTLPAGAARESWGTLSLEVDVPVTVELDGRALGDVGAGSELISGLAPGAHRLRLLGAGGGTALHEAAVEVRSLDVTPLRVTLGPKPEGLPIWYLTGAITTGMAGGVLLAIGASSYHRSPCAAGDASCDPSPGRATVCEIDPTACPGIDGAPFLALGIGLLSSVLGSAIGAILFEDQLGWSAAGSILLGGLAGGISAAAL